MKLIETYARWKFCNYGENPLGVHSDNGMNKYEGFLILIIKLHFFYY